MDGSTPNHAPPVATLIATEGLLTVEEAAAYLGLSRTTVWGLMDRRALGYCKLGHNRRIPVTVLRKFVADNLVVGGQRG
jgi:excisionase family DNA binding protein